MKAPLLLWSSHFHAFAINFLNVAENNEQNSVRDILN